LGHRKLSAVEEDLPDDGVPFGTAEHPAGKQSTDLGGRVAPGRVRMSCVWHR
jgi:hypothetical protein